MPAVVGELGAEENRWHSDLTAFSGLIAAERQNVNPSAVGLRRIVDSESRGRSLGTHDMRRFNITYI